jgi:lantibiotic biosynthesis protein
MSVEQRGQATPVLGPVTGWRPILKGDQAARARATVRRIVDRLAQRQRGPKPYLADGSAGDALLFAHLERAFPGMGYQALADRAFAHAADSLEQEASSPSLFGGFAGIGFVAQHASFCSDEQDLDGVDEAIGLAVATDRDARACDLVNGLPGFAVYFLARLPRPGARAGLTAAVEAIRRRSVPMEVGRSWFTTPSEFASAFRRRQHPDGWFDLGLAHGISGIIVVLAEAFRVLREPGMASLIDDAVAWLLSTRLPAGMDSRFPPLVPAGARPELYSARLGWCYGDLGVATALWRAGTVLARSDWKAESLATARAALERDPASGGIADACLCHGAAGVAHILNRLYQASGDEHLGQAASGWMTRVLDMADEGSEGGPQFWVWNGERAVLSPDLSFVEGACGVALALTAAAGEEPPSWDRLLLLS